MLSQALTLFALAAASVTAIPTEVIKRQGSTLRDGINLFFSNETVKIGDISVLDITNALNSSCNYYGSCDSTPVTMKGLIFDRSFFDVDDVTVTVVSGGGYQNSWHDPLVNGLNAAASILAKCENVTIQTPCTNPEYPCPYTFESNYQCTVPRFWSINYQNSSNNYSAPPNMEVTIASQIGDPGFCETMTQSFGTLAGIFSGPLGGILTLGGLWCAS